MSTLPLAHKRALVTGASSGIGRAICEALAAEGTGLYLVGRRVDALAEFAERLGKRSSVVKVIPADLTVDADVLRLAREVQGLPGTVDWLIHSAGIFASGPVETSPVDELDAQYRCNVRAPYLLTQALLTCLKRQKGQVVFVNSTAALSARGNTAAYAASKHALKAIAESLREEVNKDGVRVVSLFLGRTATPMQEQIFRAEKKAYHAELLLQPEQVAETLVRLLQLPATAEVTDVTMRPAIKSY
jgi:short-subunit dehydrogenase